MMDEFKVVNATQLDAQLSDLGDTVRNKAGISTKFNSVQEMKSAIESISNGGSSNNTLNAEVVELVLPDIKPNFNGTIKTIQVWGWGQDQKPYPETGYYIFLGDGYSEYIGGEETGMSLGIDFSGNITGLPEGLTIGKIIAINM